LLALSSVLSFVFIVSRSGVIVFLSSQTKCWMLEQLGPSVVLRNDALQCNQELGP
jgi:hypothetical protein